LEDQKFKIKRANTTYATYPKKPNKASPISVALCNDYGGDVQPPSTQAKDGIRHRLSDNVAAVKTYGPKPELDAGRFEASARTNGDSIRQKMKDSSYAAFRL
jgi:hypothetical protein